MGSRAKDKAQSLKHHVASLLDAVDKRNNNFKTFKPNLTTATKLNEKAADLN
jgi:hypothetical protein